MLINKKIEIKIRSSNLKTFKDKYDCSVGDIIYVKSDELSKSSTHIVECKCDVCGNIKKTQYRHYLRNISNKGFYVCSLSCSQTKIKMTKLENHGDENYSGIKKRKETCKERYGDENYKNKEKKKKTCTQKYGVDHQMKVEEIKEKRKQTYIQKYGVDHPMKVEEINIKMQEKSKITKIKRNLQIPDDKKSKYEIYRIKSNNYLRKIRKKMIENWDGYDYYDSEYIKHYLILNCNNSSYPTLDHKISVYFACMNDIPLNNINCEDNIVFTKRSINCSKQSTCS